MHCNKFDIQVCVTAMYTNFFSFSLVSSSQVTLNVALNDEYTEGDLYFGPMRTEQSSRRTGVSHQLGRGLLHRGQQYHGALPILSGVRCVEGICLTELHKHAHPVHLISLHHSL